ncbi:hypothetical protein [Siphonobacter sp. SORGH_AS_1065]|uniref:hypothetical protein n=1 Tax=Siphonobacter sp. SORGH_AS_1065 TaxID=3041795 RepID=UPI0027D8A83A|nr:hypothetical protein [Siphonobacter sp. SORGH_AS_1065]
MVTGKDQGPWNVSTNTPALTASSATYQDGAFFPITVGGTVPFSGVNFAVGNTLNVGDELAKMGTQWYLRPKPSLALSKAIALESRANTLESQVAKLGPVSTYQAVIRPSATSNYQRFGTSEQRLINSWFFAKSSKRLAQVGVFIYKDNQAGANPITGGGRLQVIHKRGSTVTKLLDRVITNAELLPYNTNGFGGNYSNYEFKANLDVPMNIVSGDTMFVSLYTESPTTPIFGNENSLLASGEWNNGTNCFRYWLVNSTVPVYTDIPSLPAPENNYNAVHFYDYVTTFPTLDTMQTDVNDLKGKAVTRATEVVPTSRQIFDQVGHVVAGKGIGTDGVEYPDATAGLVQMPIPANNTQLTIDGLQNGSGRGLSFYNATGTRLSLYDQAVNKTTYTIPTGAVLMKFQAYSSSNTGRVSTIMVNLGSIALPWEAFSSLSVNAGLNATPFKADVVGSKAKKNGSELATLDDFVSRDADIATAKSNISTLQTDTTNIKSSVTQVTETATIQPMPNYGFTLFGSSEQAEIRSWFLAKSVKRITRVGVFVYKNTANGTFANPLRVQVVHKRGSTATVLANKTYTAAEIAKFNTAGIINNDFRNYELKVDFTTPMDLQVGDTFFVSVQASDKMTPVYGTANALLPSGEWNDGTYCYRFWSANPVTTTYTDVPALPSTNSNYNAVNFYNVVTAFYNLGTIDQRLKDVESGANTGNLDFEVLAPANVYFANNAVKPAGSDAEMSNYNARKEPLMLYLQHFIRERVDIFLEKNQNFIVGSRNAVNATAIVQEAMSILIGGGRYLTKTLTINRISVDTAVLQAFVTKLLYIGDSITASRLINGQRTGAGSMWLMAKEMSLKNSIDAGSGYQFVCVGDQNIVTVPVSYRGTTTNIRGGASGAGGYATSTYLRHPFRMWVSNVAGAWDLLGLKAQTGRDYAATAADKLLITKTPYGVNTPVISGDSYAILVAESQITNLGAWTDTTEQRAAVQSWIDNVPNGASNRYLDTTKTGTNRFSILKYLERYKTLANDGVTRLVVGSTAGTKVTNVNSYDVCEPSHIVICLGENDRLFHSNYVEIVNDIMELANECASQLPNVKVGVCLTDIPGPMFPERHPNYKGLFDQSAHNAKFDLYKELVSRFGTMDQQKTNRIYLIPTWHAGQPLSHSSVSFQVDEGSPNNVIQVANDDFNHPGYYANRTAGTQLYGWIAATVAGI